MGDGMGHDGGKLIALGSGLGFLVAVYNYFSPLSLLAPATSVDGTPGALLVVGATLVLALAGVALAGRRTHPALVAFLMIGTLFGILGTGLAAVFLNSMVIVALMALAGVGWLMRAFVSAEAI